MPDVEQAQNIISLIVVRHGESDANRRNIISDKNIDHELTDIGIQQAQQTAELLKDENFDLMVTSTRQRAQLTAKIINKYHGVDIIKRNDLIERDFGIIGGIDKDEAEEKMERDNFSWIDIPESEKPEEIDSRVKKFLIFLNQNYSTSTVLVSTHSDIVKSFHRLLNGISVEDSMLIEINNSEPHYF